MNNKATRFLGLLGRNIQHSQSPRLYQKLYSRYHVDYTLFDYPNYESVPPLNWLIRRHRLYSLSITAPYKGFARYYCDQLNLSISVNSVNCIKFRDGSLIGTNTDLLAVEKIFNQNYLDLVLKGIEVEVLGDGAMAQMLMQFFRHLELPFKLRSRRLGNLSSLQNQAQKLLINCCSRDYLHREQLHPDSIFWDLNYNCEEQKKLVQSYTLNYVDGAELLREQALFAKEFWDKA
jgi:shikimate dehydrogenase